MTDLKDYAAALKAKLGRIERGEQPPDDVTPTAPVRRPVVTQAPVSDDDREEGEG